MITDWASAWQPALYGDSGFYRRAEGPAGHFRTASHAAPAELAAAMTQLAIRQGCRAVVDVGAGRGELLTELAASDIARTAGLSLHGVDVVDRPAGLPEAIGWSAGLAQLPETALDGALVIVWEVLDVVPCAILEVDADDVARVVLVDPRTGHEQLGGAASDHLSPDDLDWCHRWWPLPGGAEGHRIEVGRTRDQFWASLVVRLASAGGGIVLAVDYAHTAADRPAAGSLTGYRSGRAVPPRPDGSMDVTAAVALDAVAAAGERAGAIATEATTQSRALAALGVRDDELLDPGGLGGFGWLLQVVHGPA